MKPSPQDRLGELLMLRLVAPRWGSALEQQLRALSPGGVLLVGPLPRSPETLCELLCQITRALPATPFLVIEEEGGAEDPLAALLPPLPTPSAIGAKDPRAARQAGELIGEALRLLGFNTNLAPTLDLTSDLTEKALDTRTFSAAPRVVADCGRFFVEGFGRQKILACAKHFPGLASAPPSRGDLPVSGRSMAELWRSDLVPYRELLPRLPLVLMSAAAYKAYDFDYPRSAMLSAQIVKGLLRLKLGYRGVVVAPELESQLVRGGLDLGRAAAQSLRSGCDMLVVEKGEAWQAMRRGLEEELASGKLPPERLEQSAGRIRAAKKGWAPPKDHFSKSAWERMVRRFEEFNSSFRERESA
jgi:beta-N-acetylhexosaminidase